jgi:uncharacterized membrane protein YjfL (UPF0719 family)
MVAWRVAAFTTHVTTHGGAFPPVFFVRGENAATFDAPSVQVSCTRVAVLEKAGMQTTQAIVPSDESPKRPDVGPLMSSGVGLARAGTVAGAVLVGFATLGRSVGRAVGLEEVLSGAGYFAVALGCAWLARSLSNALMFPWLQQQVREGNLAAAIVWGANSLGLGIVASHCFALDALANLPVAVVFFFVSHLALLALKGLFRALTYYGDEEEIRGDNVAVALSHGGLYVALSIIVGHGASGAFLGWLEALSEFGAFLGWAALLYPVRQLVVVWGLLRFPLGWRSHALDAAVSRQRLVPAAAVEVLGYLTLALVIAEMA